MRKKERPTLKSIFFKKNLMPLKRIKEERFSSKEMLEDEYSSSNIQLFILILSIYHPQIHHPIAKRGNVDFHP